MFGIDKLTIFTVSIFSWKTGEKDTGFVDSKVSQFTPEVVGKGVGVHGGLVVASNGPVDGHSVVVIGDGHEDFVDIINFRERVHHRGLEIILCE